MPEHLDFTAANGVPFRVVYLADGQSVNYPAASRDEPLVEFYDQRHPHTPDGQFISRYFWSTLAERPGGGLDLQGDVPSWKVDADSMRRVRAWIALLQDPVEGKKKHLASLRSSGQIYAFLIEEFAKKGPTEANGIHETLDYLVDDAKMAEASEVNNGGMTEQIHYLLQRDPEFAAKLASILFD